MNFALGLFVLSVVGADSPAICDGPAISYDVRVVRINGLEWRGAFFAELQPISGTTGRPVWTATRETAERLAELDPNGWKAPRITAASRGLAHLSDRANRKVASGLARLADGPFDHATQVAYTPQYEEIREGLALTMTGRKLDQGVLACVVLDESRIVAVHPVALAENVSAKACCASDALPASGKIASRIEVPEVVHASLAGEWLIPNDSVLVVSLGVQTMADAAGQAVVTERLMLIDASAAADASVQRASLWQPLPDVVRKKTVPALDIPMPMPVMPSRSLPQALNADGSPMPLPPLPDAGAMPSSLPGSSEPCASPQALNRKAPTTLDTASARAGLVYSSPHALAPMSKPAKAETSDVARPYVLRFPVTAGGMNMEVEIRMASPCPILEQIRSSAPPQPEESTSALPRFSLGRRHRRPPDS